MVKYIDLNNRTYKIQVRKSKRARHLQLRIYRTSEINLIVPIRCSYHQAFTFLYKQAEWIEKKISKLAFNSDKFRYLGSEINLRRITEEKDKRFFEYCTDDTLALQLKQGITIEDKFENWLFKTAKDYIPIRVNDLAKQYGFEFGDVKIKKLKSRWGSCSSKGNLSFNYKLICFETKVIDYVIVHELCHLKEMNHSPKFWRLVENILPEYRNYKTTLSFN